MVLVAEFPPEEPGRRLEGELDRDLLQLVDRLGALEADLLLGPFALRTDLLLRRRA